MNDHFIRLENLKLVYVFWGGAKTYYIWGDGGGQESLEGWQVKTCSFINLIVIFVMLKEPCIDDLGQ